MPIQAQSADGMLHEFPDGTDPSVVDGVMKSYAGQGQSQPAQAATPPGGRASAAPPAPSAATPTTGIERTIGDLTRERSAEVAADTATAEPPSLGQRAANVPATFLNQLLGGTQRTSPVTQDIHGKPTYESAGKMIETDAGPMIDQGNDKWTPFDSTRHVVLLDPQTNQPMAYNRSKENDLNLPTAAGEVLGLGMLAPPLAGARAAPALTESQQALRDFDASKVSPNLPAVTGSKSAGMVAQAARNVPYAGSPVIKGIQTNVAQVADRAGEIAAATGNAETPEEAGKALEEGAAAFRGERAAGAPTPTLSEAKSTPTRDMGFTNKAAALYDAVPIPANQPVSLTNTMGALTKITGRFPTAPELGESLQPSAFSKWADAIQNGAIAGETGAPGLRWDELKDFRSYVGRNMRQPPAQLGLGRDDMRTLYGALSQDMQEGAQAAGPAAAKAFGQANNYYRAGMDRLDNAMSVVEGADSPEKAYYRLTKMGSDRGSAADINTLQRVVRSMPQEQRDDLASTVISRLGYPTKSAAGANPENFSVGTFVSNYADLTDKAKDAMLGVQGTGRRDSVDALARVATRMKNVERLGNPSGTGRTLMTAGELTGLWERPFETASGLAATYLGSAALMNPQVTRWLVNMNGAQTTGQIANNLAKLKAMADASPDIKPFSDAMQQAAQGAPQPGP